MIRRFNSTGRRRIRQEDIKLNLAEANRGSPSFRIELDLSRYQLPDDAPVIVEAYRQALFMRFPVGTVGNLDLPQEKALSEFSTGEGLHFNVKVVEPRRTDGHPPRILATARKLRPATPDNVPSESLLPIDLREIDEVWRIEVDEATGPILILSSHAIADPAMVAGSAYFQSLILPEVLRIVLLRALVIGSDRAIEDPLSWQAQWFALARGLPGVEDMPHNEAEVGRESDEIEQWITEAVAAFARQLSSGSLFARWLEERES